MKFVLREWRESLSL